jgi:prolipoprotein diacylglyceryltransferase
MGRFFIEFYRGDPSPTPLLTSAQIVSAIIFALSLLFRKKFKESFVA